MTNSRTIAVFIAGLTSIIALLLLINRGGLIAWCALIFSVALLAKIHLRHSDLDLGISIGLATIPVIMWYMTLYYVISTYESGEVVELDIDTENGTHAARLWVLEIDNELLVYYDAEPDVANALFDGRPLRFTRDGKESARIPEATRADSLSDDDAESIASAMNTKYGRRVFASSVYYLVLGRPRDRIALVVKLLDA